MDVVAIIVFLLTLAGAQESQLNGPQNTLSVVGSNVILQCSSPSRNCNGTEWLKFGVSGSVSNDHGIISSAHRDRYSVDNSSGCDLVIKNVKLTDAGRFICRAIISSNTVEKTAYLIIQETQPNCTITASLNEIAEGDRITLKCEVGYYGTKKASMLLKDITNTAETQPNYTMNESQANTMEGETMGLNCMVTYTYSVIDNVASLAIENGKTISRSYDVTASAPEVPSFTCITSFALNDAKNNGTQIVGLATNIPNATCETSVIKALYSVRNVTLSPSRSHYGPGSVINCTAQGHPIPTIKWQEMEGVGNWTDIPNLNGSEFTMTNVSSNQYRCVAVNVVRGRRYNAASHEFHVNNAGAQESQFNGPQNTLSVVGLSVILKCSSPSKNCNGTEWLKPVGGGNQVIVFNDHGIISRAYSAHRDRYSVDNSSGCDLVIKNVELTDAGRFICRSFVSSLTVDATAYLIIMKNNLTCATNASLRDTLDSDGVQLTCEVTYNGTNSASMVWEGVTDAPDAVKTGNTIRRFYSVAASASGVPSYTCNTSFVVEIKVNNASIVGLATNMPVATCETPAIKVGYSVRDVQLSISLSNLPPGTVITCSAKGNPSPTFKWQKMENGATWMDIPKTNSNQFTTSDTSSMRYRCVAMNIVRGITYTATSHAFLVNNPDYRLGSGIGIGLLIAILVGTVAIAILVRLRYLEFHPRPANKHVDNVAQHMNHEMRSSSPHQPSAMVGEQESAYASLGADRDANEYASLEQR